MTSEVPLASISQAPPVTDELTLASWEEYRPTIANIERRFGRHEKGDGRAYENKIAYRGQKSAGWALETTLEREGGARQFTVHQYYEHAIRHHRELESITGRTWPLPSEDELRELFKRNADSLHASAPAYPYLVYLRHHGFPSPLLDWSLSAYVAAYFAFESADQTKDERVAVYVYVDTPHGTKAGFIGAPIITLLGPHVATDRRHFMQQAVYTWCV
ncbi:MAG: FRG domain-containing protein, partial [Planctomycetes bacterium]|nr:FRG domain-containing protein [Planctomycetota bacterium]